MRVIFRFSLALLATFACCTVAAAQTTAPAADKDSKAVRVACVGDTTTDLTNYPKELDKLLAADYELAKYHAQSYDVRNFGVPDTTIVVGGDKPYVAQAKFQDAKTFQPNIVVLMFGCQDTQTGKKFVINTFADEYKKLIADFADLPTKPAVFLCLPPPIYGKGQWGLNNENLAGVIIPGIKQVAKDLALPLIDLNTPLSGKPEWFPDNVHPRGDSARVIAQAVYQSITGLQAPAALVPPPASVTGANLLSNPGGEDGTTGWISRGGKLESVDTPVAHGGKKALRLSERKNGGDSVGLDVTNCLQKAGPGDYYCKMFLLGPIDKSSDKLTNGQYWITLAITDDKGQHNITSQRMSLSASDWTACAAVAAARWNSTLKSASFYVETSVKDDLLADDAEFVKIVYAAPKDAAKP